MRRRLALLLASAVLLIGAGCTPLDDAAIDLEDVLIEEGFDEAWVDYYDLGRSVGTELYISYETEADTDDEYSSEARRIAQVAWSRATMRIAKIDVSTDHLEGQRLPPATKSFTRESLERMFGARPAALDRHRPDTPSGIFAAGVVIAFLLVVGIGGGVTLLVVLSRRRARLRAAASWPPYGTWGMPYGVAYGPPPYVYNPDQPSAPWPPAGPQQPWGAPPR